MKKVDIVIPILNEYEVIDELLKRLSIVIKKINSQKINLSIVIVDDGSDPKFKEVLKEKHNI